MSSISKVLEQIRPTPKIIEIGGESFEFWQLTLEDFKAIDKETGVDLTREMLKASAASKPEVFFSSALILQIVYRSMKKSKSPLVRTLTPEQASEIITYGLKGDQLGEVLLWAISGTSAEDIGGGSGNAPQLQE